jgi:hypothetical protein
VQSATDSWISGWLSRFLRHRGPPPRLIAQSRSRKSADHAQCRGSLAGSGDIDSSRPEGLDFDTTLVKEAFAHVAARPPQAMEYFYAHLFSQNPEIRGMFPLTMSEHREHVFGALAQLV